MQRDREGDGVRWGAVSVDSLRPKPPPLILSGLAFVAISAALAAATTPATRGLVMGGYSTSLYLGLALGSFALGPVITHHGYVGCFFVGGAAGALGTIVAALLWRTRLALASDEAARHGQSRGSPGMQVSEV